MISEDGPVENPVLVPLSTRDLLEFKTRLRVIVYFSALQLVLGMFLGFLPIILTSGTPIVAMILCCWLCIVGIIGLTVIARTGHPVVLQLERQSAILVRQPAITLCLITRDAQPLTRQLKVYAILLMFALVLSVLCVTHGIIILGMPDGLPYALVSDWKLEDRTQLAGKASVGYGAVVTLITLLQLWFIVRTLRIKGNRPEYLKVPNRWIRIDGNLPVLFSDLMKFDPANLRHGWRQCEFPRADGRSDSKDSGNHVAPNSARKSIEPAVDSVQAVAGQLAEALDCTQVNVQEAAQPEMTASRKQSGEKELEPAELFKVSD